MARCRTAFFASIVALALGILGAAYSLFVYISRPLHSGITPDLVVAVILWLGGLGVGQAFTGLRKHWRSDFVGREARVTAMRASMARVVVDGVPYTAFVRVPVQKGDRVLLTGTDLGGAPLRADFVADRVTAGALPASGGGT